MMKNTLRVFLMLIIFLLAVTACGGGDVPGAICGDGICAADEDENSCPNDCSAEIEVLPTDTPEPSPTPEIDPIGYVTFAVYVSDFVNHGQSAETVLALIDLFEQHNLKGEFYLTGPMLHIYTQEHGQVIDRLRESGMTISYHVQPPHPLVPGFQNPISGLPVDQTERMITRYESERLDLASGGLIPEEPGGYRYFELLGPPPVAVDIPDSSRTGFALPIFARLGARVVVTPGGTDPQMPFVIQYDRMLKRPADLTLNRWQVEGMERARGWWDMQEGETVASFNPRDRLQAEAQAWDAERLPFIFVPMNEYAFYRSGPAPWTLIYYQDVDRTGVNSAPFDLNAPDPSAPRSDANKMAVWDAYTSMVEWGSIYLEPVTSEEILQLAANPE